MQGVIKINGDIGETTTGIGVELIDVISQVKKQPNATGFDVFINSKGGCVNTGFQIYDYLKSLGLPITTIGQGYVASIATVIFMAGSTRLREPNTVFMIHLPQGDMGTYGTADQIEAFAKEVRSVEDRLIKFYIDAMQVTKEAIKPLLTNETWLTDEQTKDFGLTTAEPLKVVAQAKFNTNPNNNQMTNEDKSWIEKKFESILNLVKTQIKNIMLLDANGAELDFPEVMEGEEVTVGAVANVDGQPANGEYVMPSGETYVFIDGALDSIVEVETEDEDFEAKYNALKQELEATTQAKAEAEKLVSEKEALITNMAKEVKEFKSQITSKFEGGSKKQKKEEGGTPAKRTLLKQK